VHPDCIPSARSDAGWLPLLRAEMPWLVMSSTAYRNADPARECLRPLLPLLRRVLGRMSKGLQAAARKEKVRCPENVQKVSRSCAVPQRVVTRQDRMHPYVTSHK
jgi:hypothetical protein